MSLASRIVSILAQPGKAALAAAVLAGAVHVTALSNDFAYDDEQVIVFDEGIHSLSTLPERLAEPYWPSSYGAEVGSWRPLTTALFGVTWVVSGGSPAAYHAVAVLLHALATALVVLALASFVPPLAAATGEPSNASLHHLLAQSLSASGRPAEAVTARQAAIDAGHRPRWRSWMLMGMDLGASGDPTGAMAAQDSAQVRTDSPEARDELVRVRAQVMTPLDPTKSTIPNTID